MEDDPQEILDLIRKAHENNDPVSAKRFSTMYEEALNRQQSMHDKLPERSLFDAIGEGAGNIPGQALGMGKSALEYVKDTATDPRGPFAKMGSDIAETAGNLGSAALGGVSYAADAAHDLAKSYGIPTREETPYSPYMDEARQRASGVAQAVKDRYGGKQEIYNTIATDPLGSIGDVMSAVSGGAGLLSKIPGAARLSEIGHLPARALLSGPRKASRIIHNDVMPELTKVLPKGSPELSAKIIQDFPHTIAYNLSPEAEALAGKAAGRSTKADLELENAYRVQHAGLPEERDPTGKIIVSELPGLVGRVQQTATESFKKSRTKYKLDRAVDIAERERLRKQNELDEKFAKDADKIQKIKDPILRKQAYKEQADKRKKAGANEVEMANRNKQIYILGGKMPFDPAIHPEDITEYLSQFNENARDLSYYRLGLRDRLIREKNPKIYEDKPNLIANIKAATGEEDIGNAIQYRLGKERSYEKSRENVEKATKETKPKFKLDSLVHTFRGHEFGLMSALAALLKDRPAWAAGITALTTGPKIYDKVLELTRERKYGKIGEELATSGAELGTGGKIKLSKGSLLDRADQYRESTPKKRKLEENALVAAVTGARASNEANLTAGERNLLKHHQSELSRDGGVHNKDGTISTVLQTTIGMDGRTYMIPSVWNGQILNKEDSMKRAAEKGWDYWPSTPGEDKKARDRLENRYNIYLHPLMEQDIN